MTAGPDRRGAAPVARLDDLTEVEAAAVLMLRARCEAAGAGGADRRDAAQAAFDAFLAALGEGARRPLSRHAAACPCVGGDEAAIARLVADAADGARGEALLLAGLLAAPRHAARIVALAAEAGRRLGPRAPSGAREAPFATLH